MKRVLSLLIAVLLALVIAFFAMPAYQQKIAEQDANDLVMSVSIEALSNWDPVRVIEHASSSLLAETPDDFYSNHFRALSTLGNLQEIQDINYELSIPPWWKRGELATASYSMRAFFQYGDAEIIVRLSNDGRGWEISFFLVQAAILAA